MKILSSIVNENHINALEKPFPLSAHLKLLLSTINKAGGLALLVGGCVRDHGLGIFPKDIDMEIYGLEAHQLEELLAKHFKVIAIGKSFGILKVFVNIDDQVEAFEVALPRKENKQGQGHKGFLITTDPFMPFFDASLRRDFTINAMGIEPNEQLLIDAHGGQRDLQAKILRHVSKAFLEDPLRVLRAAQFCARFALKIDDKTLLLCKSLKEELKTLSQDRIFWEIKKLMLSSHPSLGFIVLQKADSLASLFPELFQLIDCPQDKEWHPEGDVWVHTLMVIDEAAKLLAKEEINEEEKLIVMLASLCHDLGKPLTTIEKDGRIKSPGHEQAGIELTISLLSTMGVPKKLHDIVASLVGEHLKPYQLYRTRHEVTDGAIRRLAARCDIGLLLLVSQADFLGRTTDDAKVGVDPSARWLKEKVLELMGSNKAPRAILQGRHLFAFGLIPGPQFGHILRQAFEAQMDGQFVDEAGALEWLKKLFEKSP
jgi:tRNA nucleotidyltransferase (CCA-adding enzyme)